MDRRRGEHILRITQTSYFLNGNLSGYPWAPHPSCFFILYCSWNEDKNTHRSQLPTNLLICNKHIWDSSPEAPFWFVLASVHVHKHTCFLRSQANRDLLPKSATVYAALRWATLCTRERTEESLTSKVNSLGEEAQLTKIRMCFLPYALSEISQIPVRRVRVRRKEG